MNDSNIYESEMLLSLSDSSMHPGGLRLTERAARLADIRIGMTVLDIGCGTGAVVAYLEKVFRTVAAGLEVSEKLVKLGSAKCPGIRLNPAGIPFKEESLDAVIAECMLSVRDKMVRVLPCRHGVLKPE